MSRFLAPSALLPSGWASDVSIETNAAGDIVAVVPDSPREGVPHLPGPVLPGMPNVHSHAFQRVLAGRAERGSREGRDSFWTWRELMYGVVAKLEPDDLEAIATWVYTEMLQAGYTAVGEFHYLHHGPDGVRYAQRTELSERLIAAATKSGIGLTLLPALYTYGGFGKEASSPRQRRFIMDASEFCSLWDDLALLTAGDPQLALGVAPHSLRAVSPEELATVVAHVRERDASAPIHIHVAEQRAEVDACVAWSGARPVAWLLDHAPVGENWCFVHATHVDQSEIVRAAESGVVVGVCPTTEANLGDGIFPARSWTAAHGRIGIGSDSQVTIDPGEELRWFEYAQRLVTHRRAVLCDEANPSVAATLYRASLAGGAQALGRRIGSIAPGFRADLVVLVGEDPAFAGADGDDVLDRYVFGGVRVPVRDVMVGGRWVVKEGQCAQGAAANAAYMRTVQRLFGAGSTKY